MLPEISALLSLASSLRDLLAGIHAIEPERIEVIALLDADHFSIAVTLDGKPWSDAAAFACDVLRSLGLPAVPSPESPEPSP